MAVITPKVKVSKKGGFSIYNLGQRWPVTLYADQWEAVLAKKEALLKFIKENRAVAEKAQEASREAGTGTTDDTGRVTL